MKTVQQWWDEVSNDPEKMIVWLKKQYHGEVTAEARKFHNAGKNALGLVA